MDEILEAVKLRLRFDNTGEFEESLLQLLKEDLPNEKKIVVSVSVKDK